MGKKKNNLWGWLRLVFFNCSVGVPIVVLILIFVWTNHLHGVPKLRDGAIALLVFLIALIFFKAFYVTARASHKIARK